MKKIFPLLLLLWVSFTPSCFKIDIKPDEPKMPPLTTEGRNTFGCYINGEPWVADVPFGAGFSGVKKLEAFYHPIIVNPPREYYFAIRARRTNKDGSLDQTIIIEIENVQDEGTYEIIFRDELYDDVNYNCIERFFELDTFSFHEVNLTRFDTLAKIASGTFSFTAINQDCNDTLLVTDGRFDDIYKP